MRSATRIIEGEWVISITAMPSWALVFLFAVRNSCLTDSCPVAEEEEGEEEERVNRKMVSRMTPALSPSKALVGSSSTSTFGRLTKALAIHSRCACPPLKPLPPSPIRVL